MSEQINCMELDLPPEYCRYRDDGGDVSPGTWSDLKEFASAPSGGDFEYHSAFMDDPDVYRCFYVTMRLYPQYRKIPGNIRGVPISYMNCPGRNTPPPLNSKILL